MIWISVGAGVAVLTILIGLSIYFVGPPKKNSDDPAANVPWNTSVDPPPAGNAMLPDGLLTLQPKTSIKGITFSSPETGQATVLLWDRAARNWNPQLWRFDLQRAQPMPDQPLKVKLSCQLMAVSPSGTYFVIQPEVGGDLEVWQWTGRQAVKRLTVKVRSPNRATFVNEDVLLIVYDQNHVVCMNHKTKQALYKVDRVVTSTRIAISPGRKYFVGFTRPEGRAAEKMRFRVYDSLSGRVTGVFENPNVRIELVDSVAFRPDGKRFAAVCFLAGTGKSVLLWDVATGKLTEQFGIEKHMAGRLQWAEPGYLLSNKALIDINRKAIVWNYDFEDDVLEHPPDRRVWLTESGERCVLSAHHVPSEAVSRAVAGVMDTNAPPVLKAGGRVSLAVTGIGSAAFQKRVADVLKQRLGERNIAVGPSERLKIVARFWERRSNDSTTFRKFNSRSKERFSVTNQRLFCQLALVDSDKRAYWSDQLSVGFAEFERLKQGADPTQELLERRWSRVESQLKTYRFPEAFHRWTGKRGAGESKLSADGESQVRPVR